MLENQELCAKCGGKCCKIAPGAAFPKDFGLPGDPTKLKLAFESGKWAIDWWEGDARKGKNELGETYFVRPAIKGKEGNLRDPAWGGECTFLTEVGCSLPVDERPLNCKMTEPQPEGVGCTLHKNKDKRAAAVAWIPFTKLLESFMK